MPCRVDVLTEIEDLMLHAFGQEGLHFFDHGGASHYEGAGGIHMANRSFQFHMNGNDILGIDRDYRLYSPRHWKLNLFIKSTRFSIT
jgi:hypothetical protein